MKDEDGDPPTVAVVLGRTARDLRGDRKVELVARAAKSAGLNWGTGRIADLEAGRVSPTLPTLFALCRAFGDLLDRPVTLAELFPGDGLVTLNPGATVELAELRAALGGQPIGLATPMVVTPSAARLTLTGHTPTVTVTPTSMTLQRSLLEADYRMAHSLGLDVDEVAEQMEALWGRSFTAERDHRAGPGANPQKRGRISRELKAELQEAINRGDD